MDAIDLAPTCTIKMEGTSARINSLATASPVDAATFE
jgi:hypothetical protein